MTLTWGQELAREQLREIERVHPGGLELLKFTPPKSSQGCAIASVSVPCRDMPSAPGGLHLRDRERVTLFVPPDFPFRPASLRVSHTRFDGHPHVQWRSEICLYVSPSTEWDSGDAMYGFVGRLEAWFRMGSLGSLDPAGAPLHPPVTYPLVDKLVVPQENTPTVSDSPWMGLAHTRAYSDKRVDIVGWSDLLEEAVPNCVGAAILLPGHLSWEYPKRANELLVQMEQNGVSRQHFLLTLAVAARRNLKGQPLFVLIGSAMRGVSGKDRRLQHLTAWFIDHKMATGLRLILEKYSDKEQLRALGKEIEQVMSDWVDKAVVGWCTVREARPEIVTRRDEAAPLSWFRNKTVSVWGCGALGCPIAEYLVRAGVRKIILRDKGKVTPGLLVRQPFYEGQIGMHKAEALAKRLSCIRPNDLDVCWKARNIFDDPLDADDWTDGADVVIDATAVMAVLAKLENRRKRCAHAVPVVSIVVDHLAEHGLMAIATAEHSGGPADVLRRAKVEASRRGGHETFVEKFWPSGPRRTVFQPEPGCSEATFVGSAADAASLGASMINLASCFFEEEHPQTAYAHFITQPHVEMPNQQSKDARFLWSGDRVFRGSGNGYEVRVSREALQEMVGWIRRATRLEGSRVETGGVLFGQRDDAVGVVWVTEVIGPPPDSRASAREFVCGINGVSIVNAAKSARTGGSVQYIGMWHTHPGVPPVPSERDLNGMAKLLAPASPSTPKPLLLIMETDPVGAPVSLGAYVFSRPDFETG